MTSFFDPAQGTVVVVAELQGPSGTGYVRLVLDTGATVTMVNVGPLVSIGYDLSSSQDLVQVTTGSDIEYVRRISVQRIAALGHEKDDMPVLAHTLPASAGVDGLLGADFMRGHRLVVDFEVGTVALT